MDAIFLDIKDVEGDTDIKGFDKKIEVLSFSHGVAAQITGDVSNENRTSGRPMHQDFTATKYVDKASPKLNQKCCEGTNLGEVTVTVARNDAGVLLPFLVYKLKDCVISSVSIGGGSGGGKPVETLSLNYSAIEWKYVVQKQEGGKEGEVVGKWSVSANNAD
jgi:type VI secretion system secreted protein Hcp